MPRKQKTGLEYYNIDTDIFQNRKIKRLIRCLGAKGYLIYSYLLTEIYRDKGCFLEWDENTAFDVSDALNESETLVSEVVSYCCNVGLFNKELRISENVLTTKNIQEFWIKVSKQANRKCSDVDVRFSLVSNVGTPNSEDSTLNRQDIPPDRQDSTQSKVKKSKHTLPKERERVDSNNLKYKNQQEFLNDWNNARKQILRKESNIASLTHWELIEFRKLNNEFNIEDFKNGMRGLFNQKGIFQSSTLRPKHFLSDRNIEKYIDAHKNNSQIYEDKKKESRI